MRFGVPSGQAKASEQVDTSCCRLSRADAQQLDAALNRPTNTASKNQIASGSLASDETDHPGLEVKSRNAY